MAKTKAKPTAPPADRLWLMYRKMVEIRKFEEHVWDVYTRGLMPGLAHLYIGEEAVAVGACTSLRDDDFITSTHRGHGHCLAKGGQLDRMMAEIMGKEAGYCRGKGGSMHIADMSVGILGANGIVGGGFGIATGAALSAKLRQSDQVCVCFFGDGAANQGIMLETINMAVIWNLPAIYVCENNQYGEHTPFSAVTGVKRIADRALGLGLEGVAVDGSDVLAMHEATSKAVARARQGKGPTLIEALTYRFRGHHVGDGGAYRTKEELQWWMDHKDPINLLGKHMLKAKAATQAKLDALQEEVEQQVLAAIEFAKNSPLPPPEQAYEDLYA
ncbi:MAG: thiamine pyrophosphate-dependent dehydrogenase E1 component subunit alpha [Candidatus Handelsmanbacteria bacterium]|nr:thiamine pyrophosphate-dependent dehydrogenase E1 component subunit alpha [Candidatus Handelsmanbacteria bacterium]